VKWSVRQGYRWRSIKAENEVALPMARYGTVVGFSGALADDNLVSDEALGA
jgi:hypothetical protein